MNKTSIIDTAVLKEKVGGDGEDAAEYYILSYAKTYLVPKQQELQMA